MWEGGWLAVSVALRERWSVTRPEVRPRNPAFLRRWPRVRTEGASLGGAQRLGRATVQARSWASVGDRYLRAPGLGTELSADVAYLGGGVSLVLPTTPSDSMRAYVAGAYWRTESPNRRNPAADPRRLDWRERDLEAGVQHRMHAGPASFTVGADARRTEDGLDGVLSGRWSGTAYATVGRGDGPWRVEAGAELGTGEEGRGALVRVEREGAAGTWLGAELSWRDGGRDGGYEIWSRGLEDPALFSALGIEVTGAAPTARGRRTVARLEGGVRRDRWEGEAGLFLHRYGGVRRPAVRYRRQGEVVTGSLGPVEAGKGRILGMSARLAGNPIRAVRASAAIEGIGPSGSGGFDDWWSGVPRLTSTADVPWALRPGWQVHMRVQARTAVRWAGLEAGTPIASISGGGAIPGHGRRPLGGSDLEAVDSASSPASPTSSTPTTVRIRSGPARCGRWCWDWPRHSDPYELPATFQRLIAPLVSEGRPVSERFPAASAMEFGADGRLWVRPCRRPRDPARNRWLVFVPGGTFWCHVTLPDELEVYDLGADYVLGETEDELGFERVVMYDLAAPAG